MGNTILLSASSGCQARYITNYLNPAGFNVTQVINGAQQPTNLSYGANGAVSSITYTPWGAISTMCGGQGCAQSQETRQYNSRLQPVLMELGNSSNPTADYCLVYNYYTSVANPTGCAMPSQGTGDNGNIIGKYYQANADTSYSHAGAYTYDGVNRLLTAVATGSQAYNLTYSYDQYGNGTCVMNGSTQGFCPQYSYNSANNHITNTGFNYDPAGDLLWDGGSNYEYDAEGRAKHSYSTGQWQYPTYNALGQRVEDYQGTDPMTLTYPRDIFGQRTGTFAQWPSQNWTGWNVYWSQIAGQRLNMGGASAYIDHADVIGSTTMETDPAGGVQWKIAYYPWGQILAQGGIRQSVVWAGLDWQVNDPSYPSATREYNDGLGRWLTPDPGGVKVFKLDDPQTWNMYAYVGNNPTSRNDPSGLVVECSSDLAKKDAQRCQEIIDLANKKDKNGNYVNPKLHSIYDRLNQDKRVFTIENAKLNRGTLGLTTLRGINAAGTDFSSAAIQMDFNQIAGLNATSPATMVPGFEMFSGLIGKKSLERAENFGHEGAHGVWALDNPIEAVTLQRLINDEIQRHSDDPELLREVQASEPLRRLTETYAEQIEQIINEELNGVP